jgi:D-alanyl-lipoteichoic acid acyltransferase DltB (MBOAT superfamily)
MFKKVVLADNLAPLVEMAYNHPKPGALLVALGTLAFGFQIYCDFSGYSDIARGIARLLGFELIWNFNLPYFATNLREFWRRWHISLSTWLRDYLYISLGGNRRGALRTMANLFATMLLGGLWHGAAWNFLAWGAWHGCGLCIHRLWMSTRSKKSASTLAPALAHADSGRVPAVDWQPASPVFPSSAWPPVHEDQLLKRRAQCFSLANQIFSWALTIIFVFYGWLLFRAGSWHRILLLTRSLADPSIPSWSANYALGLAIFVSPVILIQLWQARTGDLLAPLRLRLWSRSLLQGVLLLSIVISWNIAKMPFIYFQF